ncbi:MAG: T9SS type A sorting domain-containing protein, partial [Candidatus Eisenbacteria bacterium]|nr:T9SS type A sorting domain-containing protein [Candidatus Eisenbacteria bacterium]
AGATRDSLYEAELRIVSDDAPLPGAGGQPDLVVTLRAQLTPGEAVGVGGTALPTATRLYPPYPNPLRGASTLRFDLARRSHVTLAVFDLTGRRVATLASRAFEPGDHRFHWDGRGEDGRALAGGLYFVRISGDQVATETARLAVIR